MKRNGDVTWSVKVALKDHAEKEETENYILLLHQFQMLNGGSFVVVIAVCLLYKSVACRGLYESHADGTTDLTELDNFLLCEVCLSYSC